MALAHSDEVPSDASQSIAMSMYSAKEVRDGVHALAIEAFKSGVSNLISSRNDRTIEAYKSSALYSEMLE